jgi:hypothetical protein
VIQASGRKTFPPSGLTGYARVSTIVQGTDRRRHRLIREGLSAPIAPVRC